MALEKATLDNGLKLYVDHVDGSLDNNVTMFVPYGSVNEQPGDEGVAHAFEHCVHLKTDDFESKLELDRHANINGMVTNANTFYTRTRYFAHGLGLEPNMRHLSQVTRHTHLPADAVEHEMKAIRREAITKLDNADLLHSVAVDNAVFGLPYGRRVIGYHDRLDFDAEKLQKLHQRYYKLGNMALVVVGAATMDDVTQAAKRYFDKPDELDNSDYDEPEIPFSLSGQHRTGMVSEDSQNVRLTTVYPVSQEARDSLSDHGPALGMATRAMSLAALSALRYEQGIAYSSAIGIMNDNHPNTWSVAGNVITDPQSVDAAEATLKQVFSRKSADYSDDDLAGVVAIRKYTASKYASRTDGRSEMHLGALESYREPSDVKESLDSLKAVTVKDIRNAIDGISDMAQSTEAYVHRTGSRAAIGEVDRIIERSEIA